MEYGLSLEEDTLEIRTKAPYTTIKTLASMDQSAIVGPTTQIHLYLRASNLPKSLTAQGYRQPDSLARVSVIDPARDPYETAIEYCDATDTGADEEGRIWQTFMDETEVSCVMQ